MRSRRDARDARKSRWLARSKLSLIRVGATRVPAPIRRNGASGSPSIPIADRSTGRRKGPTTRAGAASSARASKFPTGRLPPNRTDIEVLFDGLPEPIDLELDLENRVLYWTDRGDPPRGNTVNRAPIDSDASRGHAPEIVFTHLMEGIGIALDVPGDRMFVTDLAGSRLYRQARWVGKRSHCSSLREI